MENVPTGHWGKTAGWGLGSAAATVVGLALLASPVGLAGVAIGAAVAGITGFLSGKLCGGLAGAAVRKSAGGVAGLVGMRSNAVGSDDLGSDMPELAGAAATIAGALGLAGVKRWITNAYSGSGDNALGDDDDLGVTTSTTRSSQKIISRGDVKASKSKLAEFAVDKDGVLVSESGEKAVGYRLTQADLADSNVQMAVNNLRRAHKEAVNGLDNDKDIVAKTQHLENANIAIVPGSNGTVTFTLDQTLNQSNWGTLQEISGAGREELEAIHARQRQKLRDAQKGLKAAPVDPVVAQAEAIAKTAAEPGKPASSPAAANLGQGGDVPVENTAEPEVDSGMAAVNERDDDLVQHVAAEVVAMLQAAEATTVSPAGNETTTSTTAPATPAPTPAAEAPVLTDQDLQVVATVEKAIARNEANPQENGVRVVAEKDFVASLEALGMSPEKAAAAASISARVQAEAAESSAGMSESVVNAITDGVERLRAEQSNRPEVSSGSGVTETDSGLTVVQGVEAAGSVLGALAAASIGSGDTRSTNATPAVPGSGSKERQ